MSQKNVERLIGRLVTSGTLRRAFFLDPVATMDGLVEDGIELTAVERQALLSLDRRSLHRFAEKISPCLQHCDLHGGRA